MSRLPYRNHDIELNVCSTSNSIKLQFIPTFPLLHPFFWNLETLKQRAKHYSRKASIMATNQEKFANLNKLIDEIMRENVEAVEEVQSETQPEEEINVEKGNQLEEVEQPDKEATEEEKDFISKEAQELWNKVMFYKEFVCERGFGKLISPFLEVIEKRG